MSADIDRREFLKQAPVAAALVAGVGAGRPERAGSPAGRRTSEPHALETFDYLNVRLLPSRWQQQVEVARTFFHEHVSIDDVLQGFRAAANLQAPGRPLGGWCGKDSNNVFGQWLSGLTRLARVTGDDVAAHDGAHALHGVGEDRGRGRQRAHGSLSVRQARLRARRSRALRESS